MSVIFCSECGKKHEYNFAKPNFCSGCGSALGATMPSPKKLPTKQTRASRAQMDDHDDEGSSDYDEVPELAELEVDVESSTDYNTFTLGSVFGQGGAPPSRSRRKSVTLDDFKNNKK